MERTKEYLDIAEMLLSIASYAPNCKGETFGLFGDFDDRMQQLASAALFYIQAARDDAEVSDYAKFIYQAVYEEAAPNVVFN